MNDKKKIEAIKKLVEATKIASIEDAGELLSNIIHIVYGIEKTEKLFHKKTICHE